MALNWSWSNTVTAGAVVQKAILDEITNCANYIINNHCSANHVSDNKTNRSGYDGDDGDKGDYGDNGGMCGSHNFA